MFGFGRLTSDRAELGALSTTRNGKKRKSSGCKTGGSSIRVASKDPCGGRETWISPASLASEGKPTQGRESRVLLIRVGTVCH